MKFEIPVRNLESLEKKIKKLSKKTSVTFAVDPQKKFKEKAILVYDENTHVNYEKIIIVAYYDVEIEGKYQINGWEFVATLEHTEAGNIVRKASDIEIPEKFFNCGPKCDHCNRIRNRLDTYLVVNENKEFKQVGKQCLNDYTGLDATVIAGYAEILRPAKELEGVDDEFIKNYHDYRYLDAKGFKYNAYKQVKSKGYNSETIIKAIAENTKDHIDFYVEDEYMESELSKIDEWVESINVNNDYLRNATTAWKLKYVENRDLKLIASLINVYLKEIQRNYEKSNTTYAGNVGDKITIKVMSVRILFTNTYGYGYNTNTSFVYKLVDDIGKVYKWSTGIDLRMLKEGSLITATIKSLEEYKGEKQTVITRGKII